ncbi:GvpL/GvpF family gas vesicle protein [Pirellulaceae bacterium SH449]
MSYKQYSTSDVSGDRWMLVAVAKKAADLRIFPDNEHCLSGAEVIEVSNLKIVAKRILHNDTSTLTSELAVHSFSEAMNYLHASADILPVRFGVILSQQEIVSSIFENEAEYLATLNRIENCSELNIRWAIPEPTISKDSSMQVSDHRLRQSGGTYLRRKLEHKRKESQVQGDLDLLYSQFRERYPDAIQNSSTSVGNLKVVDGHHGDQTYTIAKLNLLVRRSAVRSLLSLSKQLLLRHEPPTVASGPWPPFSFMESEGISKAA